MKFDPLFLSPQWLKEYHTKYPHGLSVLENIIEWVNTVNQLIDYVNLSPDKIEQIMNEWKLDGTLGQILDDILLNKKADKDDLYARGMNIKLFGAKGDGVTDDTEFFNLAINSKLNIFIPDGEYILSGPLHLEGYQTISGAGMNTKLRFTASSGNAFMVDYAYNNLKNMRVYGNENLTAFNLNTLDIPVSEVVDSKFEDLRIENFGKIFKTKKSWDNSFVNCRFHNCTFLGELESATNQIVFRDCRFSTFTQGFVFINCQNIVFDGCDLVGPSNSNPAIILVQQLFQSTVSFNDCYMEHIDKFARIGTYNESSLSVLNVRGGYLLGSNGYMDLSFESRNKPSRINVIGLNYLGARSWRPNGVYHIGKANLSQINNPIVPVMLKYFKGDKAIDQDFVKVFPGDSLLSTIHTGYITVEPAPWNGVRLSTSLTVGKDYTLCIKYKSTTGGIVVHNGGESTTLSTSDKWVVVYIPFMANNSVLTLAEGAGASGKQIDISDIKIYEGLSFEPMADKVLEN